MKQLGEDVSEVLEYVPASFRVIRHVRPEFACETCDRIVQDAAPKRPTTRGTAGPGLLAHVLMAKYGDHLPLYRQCDIYAHEGVDLERSTLAGWIGQCNLLLRPLVAALNRYVFSGTKVYADDIPVPVLAPGEGKTKTARLWVYVRDDRPASNDDPPAVWSGCLATHVWLVERPHDLVRRRASFFFITRIPLVVTSKRWTIALGRSPRSSTPSTRSLKSCE